MNILFQLILASAAAGTFLALTEEKIFKNPKGAILKLGNRNEAKGNDC